LQEGEYIFTLTVTDERMLENSDTVSVIVREEDDQPPVAKVLSSPPITLPIRTSEIHMSRSHFSVVSLSLFLKGMVTPPERGVLYQDHSDWDFFLFQDVLNNSDHQAVLFLDVYERDLVELILEVAVAQVSRRQKDMLIRQVGVLLGVLDSDISVREISTFNEHSTRLVFLVSGGPGRPPLTGHSVAMELRNKFRKQKNEFLIFRARRVDTVICQLNCSSHGECDSFTRRCVCHPFWMENLFNTYFWDAESNCEWSVLYVTIASFMIVVAIATVIWGIVCCCRRRKSKVRRKSRYKMLEGDDQESLELQLPRPGKKNYPFEDNCYPFRDVSC
uniref:Si:ch211-193k19.1 n=1 Tax=Sinocyclocheilus grahami TaxID=75366 RepID=A0A672KGR9_SINGR